MLWFPNDETRPPLALYNNFRIFSSHLLNNMIGILSHAPRKRVELVHSFPPQERVLKNEGKWMSKSECIYKHTYIYTRSASILTNSIYTMVQNIHSIQRRSSCTYIHIHTCAHVHKIEIKKIWERSVVL